MQEMDALQKKVNHSASSADVNQEIDSLIQRYEKSIKEYNKKIPGTRKRGTKYLKHPKGYRLLNKIASGLSSSIIGAVIGLPMLKVLPNRSDAAVAQAYIDYLGRANKEEYYCDMFAGIYNFSLTFTYGFKHRNFTANEIPEDKLQYLTNLEKEIRELSMSPYPTTNERNKAAYDIAKTILSGQEKLTKEVKAYCEWIVKNYSNLEKTNAEQHYNSATFDPSEAKDLDEHIQNLILNNNITVTESYHHNRRMR
jgi:hypothetical protein